MVRTLKWIVKIGMHDILAAKKEGTTFITIPALENIGHDDIQSQNSIAGTRIIEEKQRYIGIEIIGTIKLDVTDEVGGLTAEAKPQGLKGVLIVL